MKRATKFKAFMLKSTLPYAIITYHVMPRHSGGKRVCQLEAERITGRALRNGETQRPGGTSAFGGIIMR